MTNHRRLPWRVFLVPFLTVALTLLLASCAGVYVDPGATPARVRVQLDYQPAPAVTPPGGGDLSRDIYWDWGLYLVAGDGRLLPLAPATGEHLQNLTAMRLVRDTVFLAPPGRLRLRLMVDGYVRVRQHLSAVPLEVAFWQEDLEMDISPGQEVTVTRKLSGLK